MFSRSSSLSIRQNEGTVLVALVIYLFLGYMIITIEEKILYTCILIPSSFFRAVDFGF